MFPLLRFILYQILNWFRTKRRAIESFRKYFPFGELFAVAEFGDCGDSF